MRFSPSSCKINASNLFDLRSIIGFDINDNFEDFAISQLFALFIIDVIEKIQAQKANKNSSTFDAEKQAKLFNKIFNYIHIAKILSIF